MNKDEWIRRLESENADLRLSADKWFERCYEIGKREVTLLELNARLKATLRWYADARYRSPEYLLDDEGRRAREALADDGRKPVYNHETLFHFPESDQRGEPVDEKGDPIPLGNDARGEALAIIERQLFRVAAQGIMDDPKVPAAFDVIRRHLTAPPTVPEALEALEEVQSLVNSPRCQITQKEWAGYRSLLDSIHQYLTTPPTVPEALNTERMARYFIHYLPDHLKPGRGSSLQPYMDALDQALAQHSEPGRGECGWSLDDEGYYQTECGTEFEMVDFLTLEETSMKYCSNCGRRIRDDGRMGDA